MAYPNCRWCGGNGCIQCESERKKDAAELPQGAINVHLQSPRQLASVRQEIIQKTGQEPVICLHLYATSVEELQEAFLTRSPGDHRRESALGQLLREADARMNGEPIRLERLMESDELRHARQMKENWERHTSNYARSQVAFWDGEITRLLAERDAPPAPEDTVPDDEEDDEDDEEKEAAASATSPKKRTRKKP